MKYSTPERYFKETSKLLEKNKSNMMRFKEDYLPYVDEYKLLGKAIVLYIVNNREENITISCEDMSINGYMVTPFFVSTVYSGKYAIDEITILSTDLEENDITEIENFALKFRAYNSDTYQTIVTTEELSFSTK